MASGLEEATKNKKSLTEKQVSLLFDLIDTSIRKDKRFFRSLKVWRDMLKGDHWKHLKGNRGRSKEARVTVNLAHAHVRSLMPTVYFKDPTVDAMPPHPRYEGKHETYNAVINNTNRKVGFSKEMKKTVFDAVVFPEGWFKWVVNRPEDTKKDPNKTTETGKAGPTQWLTKGAPVAVRLSPSQVIVDSLAAGRDPEQARFIAIRYRRPLSEIKTRYKVPAEVIGAKFDEKPTIAKTVRNLFDDFDATKDSSPHDNLVTIYEVWIHRLPDIGVFQQMLVLMEGVKKPIRPLTDWSEVMGEGFNEYPFDRLTLNPIPDENPVSELEVWDTLQTGVNWLMSRLVALTEMDKQVWEMNSTKLKNPQKARKQFLEGGPRALIDVQEEKAFTLVQPTFVGRDNYTLLQTMLSLIQQVSGLGQNRRGSSGIRTATEADLIEQGVQIKTSEKVDTVSVFLVSVITKEAKIIRALVKENEDEGMEWVFRIGGDTGTIDWKFFNSDDLDWLPEIEIRVDSFRKLDSGETVRKLQQALVAGLQMMQAGRPVNLDPIYRQMLVALNINDTARILNDDLADIIQQTTELLAMVMGESVEVSPEDNHVASIKVIEAFRNSETFAMLSQKNPGFADSVDQHLQQHMEFQKQSASAAARAQSQGENPFDDLKFSGGGAGPNSTPQSAANQATAQDRTTVNPGRQTP